MQAGNLQEAEDQILRGLKIRASLAEKDPTDSRAQRDLSLASEQYGRLLMRNGKIELAIAQFMKTLEIREMRSQAASNDLNAKNDLAISLADLGDAQLMAGRLDGALDSYESCFKIVSRLASVDPSNAQTNRELSRCHVRIGQVRVARGEYEKAVASFTKGAGILRDMVASGRMAETVAFELEATNWKIRSATLMPMALGNWDTILAQPADSLADLLETRAIEMSQPHRSRFEDAAIAAKKLIAIEDADSFSFHIAARTFCRCAASIGLEEADEQLAKRKQWFALAISSLKKSFESGERDYEDFKRNSDFDLVRNSPELEKLVSELRKPSQ